MINYPATEGSGSLLAINKNIFTDLILFHPIMAYEAEQTTKAMNLNLVGIHSHFNPDTTISDVKLMLGEYPLLRYYLSNNSEDNIYFSDALLGKIHTLFIILDGKKKSMSDILSNDSNEHYTHLKEVIKAFTSIREASAGVAKEPASLSFYYSSPLAARQDNASLMLYELFKEFMVSVVRLVVELYPSMEDHMKFLTKYIVNGIYLDHSDKLYSNTNLIGIINMLSHKNAYSLVHYHGLSQEQQEACPWLFCEHLLAEICLEILKQEHGKSNVRALI